MPNQIDANGIQIQTLAEILTDIINGTSNIPGFKQIYGSDINTDQNSPDGQMINIFALSKQDILDLIVQDYNSKDPDQAVGVALDGICQLCGISRQGGTYTEVMVTVTVDRAVNLNGQDTLTPFTISDSSGNLFYLITSVSLTTGATALAFKSANIGYTQVLANTLTIPVTAILGIVSVNNAAIPYQIGQDEETDAILRLRRQKSIAIPAQGMLEGLLGGLLGITGIADAAVYENDENTVDSDGVPAHSIWVIVEGGTDDDVSDIIYTYRNAGCGMKGSETVSVTQIDGSTFDIYFDRALYEYLYVTLYVTSLSGSAIDYAALRTAILAQYLLGIYEVADITSFTALVHSINPDLLVTAAYVRKSGGTDGDTATPSYKKNKFIISADTVSIIATGGSSSSSSSSRSSSSSSSCKSSSSSSSRSSSSRSSSSSSSSRSSSSSSRSSSCSSSSSTLP